MRSIRRGTGLVLGAAAALVLTLTATAPASAEDETSDAPSATWTLVDTEQKVCLRADRAMPNRYVIASIEGTWTTDITTGVRDLPPGSVSHGGITYPPDTDGPSSVHDFVGVSFGPTPAGDHIAELWATDGEVTQTTPILLRSTEDNACRW